MKPQHSRTGVTFIEVLVVLIIIAAIAAILFPVFQKVHEGSHHSCQSMMKQLGLAYTQYVQDADEKYPVGVNAVGNGWAGQLYSFVKSTDVYHCPDDPHEGKYISYAENQNIVTQKISDFMAPTATVQLYEFSTLNCDPTAHESVSAIGIAGPQKSTCHDPQTYGLNFLAADGHVKWLKPGQVSSGLYAANPVTLRPGGRLGTTNGKPNLTFAIK